MHSTLNKNKDFAVLTAMKKWWYTLINNLRDGMNMKIAKIGIRTIYTF